MQVFNRHVSGRSLTVFAFEVVLISGSIALAGELHGISGTRAYLWRIAIVTAVCQLSFYYNDLYDLDDRPVEPRAARAPPPGRRGRGHRHRRRAHGVSIRHVRSRRRS